MRVRTNVLKLLAGTAKASNACDVTNNEGMSAPLRAQRARGGRDGVARGGRRPERALARERRVPLGSVGAPGRLCLARCASACTMVVAGAAAAVFTCSSFQFVLHVLSKPTVVHGSGPDLSVDSPFGRLCPEG